MKAGSLSLHQRSRRWLAFEPAGLERQAGEGLALVERRALAIERTMIAWAKLRLAREVPG